MEVENHFGTIMIWMKKKPSNTVAFLFMLSFMIYLKKEKEKEKQGSWLIF